MAFPFALDTFTPRDSVQAARLDYYRALARRSAAAQASPLSWLTHLAIQLRRAIRALEVEPLEKPLAEGLAALRAGQADRARDLFFTCLADFPWQRDGFRSWTDSDSWQGRHPDSARSLDPATHFYVQKTADDLMLKPAAVDAPASLLVIPGNRAHLSCIEWQDPAYSGQPITDYAEKYTARYTSELSALFPAETHSRIGAIAFQGVASRHENRLEHFKLYQDPSWTHPRIVPTARAIFRPIFATRNSAGQWIKKEDQFIRKETPALRVIGFSIGGTVGEQIFNEGARLADSIGVSRDVADAYFRRCLGIYVGGYMSENLRAALPVRRRLLVSFLDENVVGSPELDLDTPGDQETHFTSPLRLPADPWPRFAPRDIEALCDNRPLGCSALPLESLHDAEIQLGIFAGQPSRARLDEPPAESMRSSRYGHLIPPQVEAIKTHYPALGRALAADCFSSPLIRP